MYIDISYTLTMSENKVIILFLLDFGKILYAKREKEGRDTCESQRNVMRRELPRMYVHLPWACI